ncbi:hypothetical protein [Flavobacterium macrobrachii]|uniref:Lipoprotein n=1 Tax=Flavobacterium macrobrachii TaxID=591204 RepID=A0ABS2CYS9_9FLAO|nr:hypothetical protein [Flavobacterium macrobrachii]MBM6500066.1 hypothetical protein [Flavobacterium macrobrachii]
MKKIIVALLLVSLFSCGKKEIQLPQLNETIIADVKDHSPIFMFFELNGKDTLIDVNRSNSISSTNWLFNIDKRLPLKLVIPEIQKLQAKKEKSSHKKEGSENYFTYMDKEKKTLAFLPFTSVEYKLKSFDEKNLEFYLLKNNFFRIGDDIKSIDKLNDFINKVSSENQSRIIFSFDKQMSFEKYMDYKIIIKNLDISKKILTTDKEFIY